MRENLDVTRGLILAEAVSLALAPGLGKLAAHQLVEEASRLAAEQGRHLRDVLGKDARVTSHLSAADLGRLFDPKKYLGLADQLVDRVLAAHAGQKK
jgi:3-carboxy-cis,cis-muconate cycloisomerase